MLPALTVPEEFGRMKSKAPVIIIVAIIIMGVLMWVASAYRSAGGVSPEQAKALAGEAERECVLQGHKPEECPKMVGRHHRECLEKAERTEDESEVVDESYIDCMLEAFGEPAPPTGAGDESDDAPSEADASTAEAGTGDASAGATGDTDDATEGTD